LKLFKSLKQGYCQALLLQHILYMLAVFYGSVNDEMKLKIYGTTYCLNNSQTSEGV